MSGAEAAEERKHPSGVQLASTSDFPEPMDARDEQSASRHGNTSAAAHSPLIEIYDHSAFGRFKGWLHQLNPTSGVRLWIFLIALVVTTIATRRIALLLIGSPRPVPAVPTEPAVDLLGCTPQEDIFYFDLGGTECVCNKQWSIEAYWEKVMTGFAFNVPHVIAPFHFYCVLGRWDYIVIGIFVNEILEEFILGAAARWGFLFDAAYDLESRYDSLIRDAFCCMSGLYLGVKFYRIMGAKPFFQFPVSYKWDVSSRHSIARLLLGFAQGLVSFQITSGYNSDRGRYAFNPANFLVWFGYALSIVLMYYSNRDFYKTECTRRRVLFWHVGMIAVVGAFLLPMIYPQMDAMYIVLTAELSLTIVLYGIDVILKLDFGGFQSWLDKGFVPPGATLDSRDGVDSFEVRKDFPTFANDSNESSETNGQDSGPFTEVILDKDSADSGAASTPPQDTGNTNGVAVRSNEKHSDDLLAKEISFDDWREALVECRWQFATGAPICSTEDLLRAVATIQERRALDKSTRSNIPRKRWLWLGFILILCVTLLAILSTQPWTFDGPIMYTRHWCGNPTVMQDGLRVVENACKHVSTDLY